MVFELLLATLIILVIYLIFYKYNVDNFWKQNNVPFIPSIPIFGHFGACLMLKSNMATTFNRLYNHPSAKGHAFVGINRFQRPALLVRDPGLVKKVLIKDFSSFNNRFGGADPMHDPVGGSNLFQLKNPMWRRLRMKLTPIFTSGKMKQMFYMTEQVNEDVKYKIESTKGGVLNVSEMFGSYVIDVISLVAFGTAANCLRHSDTSEFLFNVKRSAMSSTRSKLGFAAKSFLPELFQFLKMSTFDPKFTEFLRGIFNQVTTERIKNKNVRDDLIDALIAIKNADPNDELLTEDVLLAQAIVFFAAGYETSHSTLQFAFYYMSKDKNIQQKAKEEVFEILQKYNGKISYDNLMQELPYLDKVINETLRLHPPVSMLDRVCEVSDYSMEPWSNFKLPKKTPIFIPVSAIQMDPEYFPNPSTFNPSRFDGNHVSEYCYMPFGLGPHNCIGERFGRMNIKFGMFTILQKYKVDFPDDIEIDLDFDHTCMLTRLKKSLWLKFENDIRVA